MGDQLIAAVPLDVLGAWPGDVIDVDLAVELGIDVPSLIACGAAHVVGGAPVGTVAEPKQDAASGGKRAKKQDAAPEAGRIDSGTVTLSELTDYTISQPEPEVPDGD